MLHRIFSTTDGAYARIPAAHAGAGFRFGVAGIALAGAGVGFISVGRPSAPVMTQQVSRTALSAGDRFGAGRCAEGTILRFGV